jgi:hypothetical protein
MSLPEIIAFDNRQKVVAIAQRLLAGEMGVIEAARQINAFRGKRVGLDEFDPDFLTFVGIDSETNHLPLGESRRYWAADALARKDVEIARCEELLRSRGVEAASHLVARFANEKRPPPPTNIELIEKSLSATREYLTLLTRQVTDVKKLADLVIQKAPTMERIYVEFSPYMTAELKSKFVWILGLDGAAEIYLRTGKDHLTGVVTRLIPLVIADLEDFIENLNKGYSGTAKT